MQATVPIVVTLLFAGSWCLAMLLVSRIGGGAVLAGRYGAASDPDGKQFVFQSAALGHMNYGSCLTVVVGSAGLYLKVFPLLSLGHPPLLIPWADMHDLQEKKF